MYLSPEAMQVVRQALREWGVMGAAAAALGVRAGDLKAAINRNPDLAAEADEALAEHKELLYMKAVQRATGSMSSDTVLVKLLEAQMPKLFDPKARNADAVARGKPTGYRLRTFDASPDGVVDVTPKEPSAPAGPLLIEHRYL